MSVTKYTENSKVYWKVYVRILQQFRNLAIEEISFPDYLIIDNDGIYGNWKELTWL